MPPIPRSIRNLDLTTFLPEEEEDTMAHLKEFATREQIEFIIECGVYYAQAIFYGEEQEYLHAVYSRFFWQFPVDLSPSASNDASYVRLRIQHQLERVKDFMGDYKPRNEWSTAFAVSKDHTKAFARFHIFKWLKEQVQSDEEHMKESDTRPTTPSSEVGTDQQDDMVISDGSSSSSSYEETTDDEADAKTGGMEAEKDGEGEEDEDEDETISDSDGEPEFELVDMSPGRSKDYPVDLTID